MDPITHPNTYQLWKLAHSVVFSVVPARAVDAGQGDLIVDAAVNCFRPRVEACDTVDWPSLETEIEKYTRAYLRGLALRPLSKVVLFSQSDRVAWQAENHPCSSPDPLQALIEEENLKELRHVQTEQKRRYLELVARLVRFARGFKPKEQGRVAAVLLRKFFERQPYDVHIAVLRDLGFEEPTPEQFRQWVCRYGRRYVESFKAQGS
ncbi:MAG: hypothetical protein AMXMBFR81_23030 [Chthonomonas sp.]